MKKSTAALGIGAAAAGAVLALARYAYNETFYSPLKNRGKVYSIPGNNYEGSAKHIEELIDSVESAPYESVETTSFDGLKLAGRYYHVADDTPIHIQMHGYHGSAVRDFCGGNKLARDMGCSTLLVDQRAHGKSQGTTISFGINERRDLLSWIDYCRQRFGPDRQIVISGISMGATTVLMTLAEDLPDNVIGAMADCPYTSPKEIICKVCKDRKLPAKLMYPFVYLGARIFGRFNLTEASAADTVKHAKIPVLLIHGEADTFVPCAMSREIFENCSSDIIFKTFPGAGHGMSYIADEKTYRALAEEALNLMTERKKI